MWAMTIALLGAVSCTRGGDGLVDTATVVDSAGVKIVMHGSENVGSWPEHGHLSAQPRLQIGSLGDEVTGLYRVTDVARLPDDGIAIANSGTGEIKLFGSSGRFLHSLGGLGGGPGEFGRLESIGVTPDGHIRAYDGQAGRVSTFDPGRRALVESMTLTVSPDLYSLAGMRRATVIGWLRDGTLVAYYDTLEGEAIPDRDGWTHRQWMSNIHFFDRGESSEILATVSGGHTWTMVNRTGEGSVRMQGVSNPFLPTFHTATEGEIVAFGNTERFDIRMLDSGGSVVRIVRREEGRRPVSEGQRERWVSGRLSEIDNDGTERSRRQRALFDDIPFPDSLPAFEALSLQEGGRLWVRETGLDGPAAAMARWSAFDSGGQPLGVVEMPAGFQPFEIGTDYVLGLWKDALGVEYVQLYDLVVMGE